MESQTERTTYGATEREPMVDQYGQRIEKAGDTLAQTANKVSEGASQAADKAGQMAQQAIDKAKDLADDLRSKDAGELVNAAKAKAGEVGAVATDKANEAMTATGEQLTNAAQAVRTNAPTEGPIADVASSTAAALERSGEYLKQADVDMVRSDLERVIREHPIETLLVGLGVGYLLARASRR